MNRLHLVSAIMVIAQVTMSTIQTKSTVTARTLTVNGKTSMVTTKVFKSQLINGNSEPKNVSTLILEETSGDPLDQNGKVRPILDKLMRANLESLAKKLERRSIAGSIEEKADAAALVDNLKSMTKELRYHVESPLKVEKSSVETEGTKPVVAIETPDKEWAKHPLQANPNDCEQETDEAKDRNKTEGIMESLESNPCHRPEMLPLIPRQGTDARFNEAVLSKHNHYRSLHGVGPLTISDKLNKVAQEWADHLASVGSLSHRPKNAYGENIYWSSARNVQGDGPVQSWYNEITKYNWNKPDFSSATGHFTQVVWKGSKELGIGMAASARGTFVVCNYNPPGNVMGHFAANVLPLRRS